MLRIEMFGGFRVLVEGAAVPPEAWSRRAPTALVKLLALSPGHRLRREQVMDALWPELPPPAAAANVRKALHAARRNLGADAILSVNDLLCLPSAGIAVDVGEYWSTGAEARRGRDVARYGTAVELYGSGLLPEDPYEDWATPYRDELREDWLALVGEYAGLLEAGGDLNAAARAVQRLVAADPLDEDGHAWLMRLHALAGRRDEAQRQFVRLRELLASELGIEPSVRTQRLSEEIRAGEAAEPSLTSDLWERVGDLRVQSGDPAAGVKAYGQVPPTGRIHRKTAAAWLMLHHADDAVAHLDAADRLGPDPAERGRLAQLRANVAWERGDLAGAHGYASEAHRIAAEHGDTDDLAAALEALAFVSHMQGAWRPELQGRIEALAGDSLGARVARFCDFNHCLSQFQLYGTGDDVGAYARQTLSVAERVDAVPAQAFAWCLLGESLLLQAHWDEAAACLERSCALYEPLGSRSVALPWLRRAELAACVGDHAEASAYLKRATAIATVTPMARHAWARLHATAALAAVERGEPEAAIRSVRASQSAAARYGECATCSAQLNPVGAQAFALLGDPEQAAVLAAAAAGFAAAFPTPAWTAMADLAAGWATGADDRFLAAGAGFEQAGHVYWAARARGNVQGTGRS
ncbi:BTAD domain-containing putative transcriptional regulator [Cryptosporangium sp. NPDC051539]|uniref:BTAD domain-containing putative transcriptional regulator n=1 Tax=Cryptosporangium sp. NPDC051539 TaxID=3363962 RepID=UPI00378D0E67